VAANRISKLKKKKRKRKWKRKTKTKRLMFNGYHIFTPKGQIQVHYSAHHWGEGRVSLRGKPTSPAKVTLWGACEVCEMRGRVRSARWGECEAARKNHLTHSKVTRLWGACEVCKVRGVWRGECGEGSVNLRGKTSSYTPQSYTTLRGVWGLRGRTTSILSPGNTWPPSVTIAIIPALRITFPSFLKSWIE
jgi:hypothetical protein